MQNRVSRTFSAACALVTLAPMPAFAATAATFTAGTFLVTLGAEPPETVLSVEGGDAVGVVQSVAAPPGAPDKNLVGELAYEPIAFRFPPNAAAFADWVSDGVPPEVASRSGVITLGSSSGVAVSQRTFTGALISQIDFPRLDASANKEPATIVLVVQPIATTYDVVSGGGTIPIGAKQKSVLTSNFRLTIPGLDTSRVALIDSFTVRQPLVPAGGGFTPTGFEVTNLKVSIDASTSDTWFDWFEDFVVQGNNGDGAERSGTIEFLTADRKGVVATIDLEHLGIVAIGPERAEGWVTKKGAKAAGGRVVVELYVENVRLKANG